MKSPSLSSNDGQCRYKQIPLMSYTPKTEPFPHQAEWFERSRDLESFAVFWEQGLGKSKLALDTAGHLFTEGKIDALLVLSPAAVAPNWVFDEIPTHLGVPYRVHLWQAKRASTKWHRDSFEELFEAEGELAVLAMNYEAIMTEKGRDAAKRLLTKRRCLYVLDESGRIKTPGAKRTKRILASAVHAPYRRVMTGTPVDNSPFDVFTQLKFLDEDVWKQFGCNRFESFKTRFGVWIEHQRIDNGQRFKKLVEYRDLDTLHKVVAERGSRLLKDDELDLPPKLYQKRFFNMSDAQHKLYKDLRRDFMVFLEDGEMITAPLAITRMLRLQQLTSGYVPVDDMDTEAEPKLVLVEPNPRLGLLREIVEDTCGQFIVWAKFRRDITQILGLFSEMGITACRYDGDTSHEDREAGRAGFKSGEIRAFVANPSCAGEGLTLTQARTVIYYNNSFKLKDRLQSEDRAHRIGQKHAVTYIDMIATGTIDHHIVRALRDKMDYATIVTGDAGKEWI